jgi:CubicO group peptidase (beta-lactamase class C family)
MKRHLSLLFLCLLVGTSCTSDPYAELPDPLFRAYDGDDVPGAAVMVIYGGVIKRADGYGMANLEQNEPVTAATNFRLASVTKQFTAMAITMLVDDGLLDLDDPVREVLDGIPSVASAVTVRHLIQHQSGLQDYESLIPDGFEGQVRDADVLTFISSTDSLYFAPGTDYRYSNTGYALLALIIESRSGLSFPDFLRTRIFEPLGMTGTLAFVDGENNVPERAYGYSIEEGTVTFSDQSQTSAVLGDGGIYSSLDDLYQWDQALYGDDLVSDSLMSLVFTPGLSGYGFGWRIDTFQGHLRFGHTGSTRGFRTVIHRYPDDELTVIILTNRNGPAVADLAEQVASGYL